MKRARDYVPVPGRDGRVVLVSTSIRISYKSIKKEQVSLDRRRFEEFWPQYAASSGSPDNITSRSPAGPSLTEPVQTYLLVLRMTTVLKARAKIPVHEAAGDTPSLQPVSELTSRSSGAACVECGVETIPLCKHAAADSGPESSPVKTSHELKVGTGVQLAFLALRNCDISLGQRQGHFSANEQRGLFWSILDVRGDHQARYFTHCRDPFRRSRLAALQTGSSVLCRTIHVSRGLVEVTYVTAAFPMG